MKNSTLTLTFSNYSYNILVTWDEDIILEKDEVMQEVAQRAFSLLNENNMIPLPQMNVTLIKDNIVTSKVFFSEEVGFYTSQDLFSSILHADAIREYIEQENMLENNNNNDDDDDDDINDESNIENNVSEQNVIEKEIKHNKNNEQKKQSNRFNIT